MKNDDGAGLIGQTIPDSAEIKPSPTSGAELSACGRYRYRLWRRWGTSPTAVWLMLNPSTADATTDDPTIRKCIGFARKWGYGGIEVINLYAYRATDPKELKTVPDPGGPGNYAAISRVAAGRMVVCGWGRNAVRGHVWRVLQTLRDAKADIRALKINADGSPMHPLYVPYETLLIEYPRLIGSATPATQEHADSTRRSGAQEMNSTFRSPRSPREPV